jgi:putative SOS response-associated peptidase YedK
MTSRENDQTVVNSLTTLPKKEEIAESPVSLQQGQASEPLVNLRDMLVATENFNRAWWICRCLCQASSFQPKTWSGS